MVLHRRQSILIRSFLIAAVLCADLPPFAQPSAAAVSGTQSSSKKVTVRKKKKSARVATRRRSRPTLRSRRMHAAFVASSSLKPMAQQLLQDRTPAAYAGVEAYARRHSHEDAGALAWLVLGYAHVLDKEYAQAVDPLTRAQALAGDLGDYVSFYLGTAYFQSGKTAEAVTTLTDFEKQYPDSLLLRDERVLYGSALLAQNRPKEAIAVLEKDRQPQRADLELALGQSYAAAGQAEKATEILRNLYITMPLSPEASQADVELKKLAAVTKLPPLGLNGRRTRADLLARGKRYSDAADEYRGLVSVVGPDDRPEIQLALASALYHSGQDKEAKKVLDAMDSLSGGRGQSAAPISTWEKSLATATTKQDFYDNWQTCARLLPPVSGCSAHCSRREITICSNPIMTKRSTLTGSCNSASRAEGAHPTRIGK